MIANWRKEMLRKLFVSLFIILTAVCLLASPVAADRITLIGEVNDNQQIVANNEIYDVNHNAAGDDLVLNFIAQKVKVVGQLKVVQQSDESDASKIITVESFEVVEE
jgi:hypothetical protein